MKYLTLGRTGLRVSRLCFGALTIGPLQANLSLERGAEVLRHALDIGINFIDTAESYGTYPYIRKTLEGYRGEVFIASKSYAYTREGMRESLLRAVEEVGRPLSIFLLHEQESRLTLRGHSAALEFLLEAREEGLLKAVGISTHSVEAATAAAEMPEIDVIHPILNRRGLGIIHGTLAGMLKAIRQAAENGKGVYAMKPLGGGHMSSQAGRALSFALGNPWVHSVAIGMQCEEEIEVNAAVVDGIVPDAGLTASLAKRVRRLSIADWCQGCGDCVKRCRQGALSLQGDRAVVAQEKCVFCGYCAAACRDFCIKVL